MNRHFFTLLILLCSTVLMAQDKVTVLTVNGQVNYFPRGANIGKRVLPGQLLPTLGVLRCDEGAKAMLVFKEQRHAVNSREELNLVDLLKKEPPKNRMGYLGRFLNFIGSSVNNTEDNDKLEKYHQRYMKSVGGVRGFAQQDASIKTFDYLSGPFDEAVVHFTWTTNEQVPHYTFAITKEGEETPVFIARTRSHELTLDLAQLSFEAGAVYHWKASAMGKAGKALSTVDVPFSVEAEALAELLSSPRLKKMQRAVEEGEQELVVLQALEDKGFKYAARSKYESLLRENPENGLIRRLYAAFLVRNNDLEGAKHGLAGLDE